MLISVILKLRTAHAVQLPPALGRANYAQTLKHIQSHDPALSAAIHDGDGPKPLTCSSLLDARPTPEGLAVTPAGTYSVRITGLSVAVSQLLAAELVQSPPPHWTLDGHIFQVEAAVCDPRADAWSGSTTYAELAGQYLGAARRVPRRVALRFAAPTSFKSGGMHVPLPLPGLVFGSLVERWNHFSPIALSPDMRRFGEEMVAISRYRLESRAVEQKRAGAARALRMGAIGEATYVALGGDPYWAGVMQMLGDFALYSGVGVQTATGMGQVRRTG